jgi:hypothetical protein
MKRAGFKVVYDPGLSIWHANAKTSSKKAPTFSLYMMMRNRYRFAVRNFDNWSLKRFLKFYLKMGLASIVRSVTDIDNRQMHQAYSKAFFYNLVFGIAPFIERRKLSRQLGPSNYNREIFKEQTPVTIIVDARSKKTLSECFIAADKLEPGNEIIAVVSNALWAKNEKQNLRFRIIVDRGYFNSHESNLGAVTAKNEWLVLSASPGLPNKDDLKSLVSSLYDLRQHKKSLSTITDNDIPSEAEELLKI